MVTILGSIIKHYPNLPFDKCIQGQAKLENHTERKNDETQYMHQLYLAQPQILFIPKITKVLKPN